MNKQLTKQIFGVPSIQTAGRIDDSDKVSAFEAAHYRCTARMRELEQQFEVKASEIRAAFVAEVAEISGGMSVPAIASIYSKDRDDPRAWDDFKLMQLAYELLLKIEEHKSMLVIEAYESGPEWQAALAQRQKALDRAFKAAGFPRAIARGAWKPNTSGDMNIALPPWNGSWSGAGFPPRTYGNEFRLAEFRHAGFGRHCEAHGFSRQKEETKMSTYRTNKNGVTRVAT
jgi:hypothetical protein